MDAVAVGRKPRKEVPIDAVSCPPALNLRKTCVKNTKVFVNELVALSPRLTEIEETSKETDADQSASVISSRFQQSEISSLASNEGPSVHFKTTMPQKPKSTFEQPVQRNFKTSNIRASNLQHPPWPLAQNGRSSFPAPLPPKYQQDQSQEIEKIDMPIFTRQKNQNEQSNRNASSRQRNVQLRSSAAYSSARSSINSSMVSWDTMSQSMYTIYTTASTIARRPAWGHYIVGIMVFSGWVLHHWYFSEYFLHNQSYLSLARGGLDGKIADAVTTSFDDSKPSMLRGAVLGNTAIYKKLDVENRNDFVSAVKSAAGAFDVMDGEKSEAASTLEVREKSNQPV